MKPLITYLFLFGAIVAISESQLLSINSLISVSDNVTAQKNGDSFEDILKNDLLDLLKEDSKETQAYFNSGNRISMESCKSS